MRCNIARFGALCALLPGFATASTLTHSTPPDFLSTPVVTDYDGINDDLLTAGLGRDGIASASAPSLSSPPTAAELRRLAIYNNYRALVDTTTSGGYGSFYGPRKQVGSDGSVLDDGDGRIAGSEYLAYADDGSGRKNITLMVQVPAHFDPRHACIVTGTSSGSRGIYGAIGTSGEWGLQRGCAVAYADKGSGNGLHDLERDNIGLIDGLRADATVAGDASHFTAELDSAAREALLAAYPHRVAVKHAHSRQNPERDWGRHTLQAIEFAFYVLNERYGAGHRGGKFKHLRPDNTLVIASSVSNGGGAALAAAELDRTGLIDAVVVSEPQIQLRERNDIAVQRGSAQRAGSGRPLYDYTSYANLLQPCAALANEVRAAPGLIFVPTSAASNRCSALRALGYLQADDIAAQASEALALLQTFGWEPESALLHASHYAFATTAIALTYANAYGRFGVEERVCGFSYAATDAAGVPSTLATANLEGSFATGNGIPPTAGLQIINDNATGGPLRDAVSVSPGSGLQDLNAEGAHCLRTLWTGEHPESDRLNAGVAEVRRNARLRGRPTLIVHGRSDALVPVGFSSRPYVAANYRGEGRSSRLSYIEVTNAQHFDAFIGNPLLAGYDTRFIPLHHYFVQALDLMYAHLTRGRPLPPSQVVRTLPRGGTPGAAPALEAANLPPISSQPPAADRIRYRANVLYVPD